MATSYIKIMKKNHPDASSGDITWKQLRHAKNMIPVPFQLTLHDSPDVLYCEEIVRLIPKKRIVAFGKWGDKRVVAKLFIEPRTRAQHLTREIEGIETLVESGVPTPQLLWQGSIQRQKIHLLLFEHIVDGVNLDVIWHAKRTTEELTPLMSAITTEIATQHVMGIVQNDLHMKNFLITKKVIYTLDGGSITHYDEILPKEQSLHHLALFFSQLGIDSDALQEELYKVYTNARGWMIKQQDVDLLHKATVKWTEKRWHRYEKKIQRSSTAFARIKTPSALIMYDRMFQSPELTQLIMDPESVFQYDDVQILKDGGSSTVIKTKLDHLDIVVKRYNIKNPWHWLRRCLRKSRAAASWRFAQHLRLFNIPTARPIAFIQNNVLGFGGKSYFIMEYISGPNAKNYFTDSNDTRRHLLVAERIVTLLINLAKLRLTHGDLKATNILIENQQCPVLIDLDGMKEHRTLFSLRKSFKKEMRRFMKNWENHPKIYALFKKLITKK